MEPFKEEWEARLHRELKSLPDLKAPTSLARRVRAEIEVLARPWWRRAWWTWPAAGRGAFVVLLALVAALVLAAGWRLLAAGDSWRQARLELSWWAQLPATLGQAARLAAWHLRLPLLAAFAVMSAFGTSLATLFMTVLPRPSRGNVI